MTNPLIIIPARMSASRFPGKPLTKILDVPMIARIYQQASRANIAKVVVATEDKEIVECIKSYGGEVVLTPKGLSTGSDRVAVAAQMYDPKGNYDIIVNLQGDLAIFDNEIITSCINGLKHRNPLGENYDIATICRLITDNKMTADNNAVKAVVAFHDSFIKDWGTGLYFTRSTCPYGEGPRYQHLGIYSYTRNALQRFHASMPTALEKREQLEQLRALELGLKIVVTNIQSQPLEINIPADLSTIHEHLAVNN